MDIARNLILIILSLLNKSNIHMEKEDPYTKQRLEMLHSQIIDRGIKDKKVLNAMRNVPRHLFVPVQEIDNAYTDSALPIGYYQTISQPFIVAFMTEKLDLDKNSKVLEIGTGSGYQAAILAMICKEVYTIEIVGELGEESRRLFDRLNLKNIYSMVSDGNKGWPENAPFDRIIITAAADHIPKNLLKQLNIKGKILMPLKSSQYKEMLVKITKIDKENNYTLEELLDVRFVPLMEDK